MSCFVQIHFTMKTAKGSKPGPSEGKFSADLQIHFLLNNHSRTYLSGLCVTWSVHLVWPYSLCYRPSGSSDPRPNRDTAGARSAELGLSVEPVLLQTWLQKAGLFWGTGFND